MLDILTDGKNQIKNIYSMYPVKLKSCLVVHRVAKSWTWLKQLSIHKEKRI